MNQSSPFIVDSSLTLVLTVESREERRGGGGGATGGDPTGSVALRLRPPFGIVCGGGGW
jgi:hypothetical protein